MQSARKLLTQLPSRGANTWAPASGLMHEGRRLAHDSTHQLAAVTHRHHRSLLAGASAAIALRDQGYEGELTLIGEESQLPYERPPLSKAVLQGAADEPDWVADEATYADKAIDPRLGTTATRIDRRRKVVVASRTEYPYDKLLIATGTAPRRLDVHGSELDGLLTLRTVEESLALRERFTDGATIVIVGAGWIGCEAAAAARQRGAQVTVVEPRSQPLLAVVGEQIGATFAALHRDHGVDLRLGVGVKGFAGDGTASSVLIKGGHSIPADTILIGVGAAPNIALADAAGLTLADANRSRRDPAEFRSRHLRRRRCGGP